MIWSAGNGEFVNTGYRQTQGSKESRVIWSDNLITKNSKLPENKNRVVRPMAPMKLVYIYIYINIWKSSQRMNLRDVGSETSVNDTVQTNKNDK